MPMPPIPAHASRKVQASSLGPRILKTVSFSLSLVGRTPAGGVDLRWRLLYFPEMIRMIGTMTRLILSHSHKPISGGKRLDEFLAFFGSIGPLPGLLLGQRQQVGIEHQIRDP